MIRCAAVVLAAVAFAACATSGSPTGATPSPRPSPTGPAVERATALVSDLIARRYDAVVERFDDTMRAAVPIARLREVWESGPGRAGEPRGISRVRLTEVRGLDQAIVTAEFERAAWDVQITFRSDGRVAGLFVRPGVSGTAAPPGDFTLSAVVHALAIVSTVLLVAALWLLLQRLYGIPGRLYFFGALIFIASQVGHVPFNAFVLQPLLARGGDLVVSAVALGLSAGLFEEIARYVAFRFWLRGDRGWRSALGLGAGHGGIEALLLALLAALGLVVAIIGTLPNVPSALVDQSALYWSRPEALALALPVERISALALHLSLAVLVMRAVERADPRYLAVAVAWHALVDGTAYYLLATGGVVLTEAVVTVFGALSVATVVLLRPRPVPR